MSVSAVASLRPLRGQCLHHATTGLLSIQIRSRSAHVQVQAVIPLRLETRRYQSNKSSNDKLNASKDELERENKMNQLPRKQQPNQQPITFRKFAGRALGAGLRSLLTALSPSGIKTAFRQSPGSTTFALLILLAIGCIFAYTVRLYFTYFYHSQFTRYPKPIANSLRRALYYTNIAPDAELALKYYKRAMDQCAELGLDPFSDEVLGIRIQTSFWLQKIGNYKGAIQVLEGVLGDCKKWVDVMEQSLRDGKVDDFGQLVRPALEAPGTKLELEAKKETETAENEKTEDDYVPENLWHKRRRILAKAIGTAVKLGELYADEHVLDPKNSQIHLVWAVESALKEFRRRKEKGVKDGEGEWLSPEEMGGTMESLGRDYERKSQFHLAIPLFFQALRLCESPCHRAVIMNNLSATFAQHPIFAPTLAQPTDTLKELQDPAMPATRKECLEAALNWAKNAYQHAKDVEGEERTPECDEACAVALCNWADVAAMMGNTELARKKYDQCIEMSGKLDFPEGVKQAQSGLRKLTTTPARMV
ncbi:Fc.00g098510.m01.CDS01 [Cosmosporella sp. VM-42]